MSGDLLRQPNAGSAGAGAQAIVHDHSGTTQGGQLDWDAIWADAIHNHTSDAEGGSTLTSPTIVTPTIASTGWTNAIHAHVAANSGSQLDHGLALTGLTDDDHTQYVLESAHASESYDAGHHAASHTLASHTSLDESITSRMLAPTIVEQRATANTSVPSDTEVNLTGCSISITPAIASMAIVWGISLISGTVAGDYYQMILDIDGSNQPGYGVTRIVAASDVDRNSFSFVWVFPLTAAAHTINLQAKRESGSGAATFYSPLTKMVLWLVGDANATDDTGS